MDRTEFISLVGANPVNRIILERLPHLNLTDVWLVSGALFQTVWNCLTGREPAYGIKDYDIFYFDTDLSWEAEGRVFFETQQASLQMQGPTFLRNEAQCRSVDWR